MKNYKKIHFVGAGGIGVSALAKWAILEGVGVSGSDAAEAEIVRELQKMGAKISIGHRKGNVPKDAELIIYSDAVPKNNPERKNKLPQKSYFEALGEITKQKKTIAISGTNGKSTTTAMIGKILIDAGMDPLVIVGSKSPAFSHGNFHYGKGEVMVLEACEHNAHMLNLAPAHIVLTNIEADHLDFYKNLENIIKAFKEYVSKTSVEGFVVYNADDKNTLRITERTRGRRFNYGAHPGADFVFGNRQIKDGRQFLDLATKEESIKFFLRLPGLFNVYNAMAACAACYNLGVPLAKIAESLQNFQGLWRRFERVGEYNGAPVISDYGHHPQAIAATLLAAREFYSERRIVLAFEPHQHHRTKALFADFVRAFDGADIVILSEIYSVAGRASKGDKNISSKELAEAIVGYWATDEDSRERKIHELYCAANLAETEAKIRAIAERDDIIIVMGAGDIYKVAERLANP